MRVLMESLSRVLLSPLPIGTIIIVVVVVLVVQVKGLCKRMDRFETKCDERLKWCVNHFSHTNPKERG